MKTNLALRFPDPEPVLAKARVVSDEDGRFIVDTARGAVMALPSASCLLRPVAGDLVLISQDPGAAYILAILERKAQDCDLDLPGNVRVNAAGGGLALMAAGSVDIVSASAVGVAAPRIHADAAQGEIRVDHLSMTGRAVAAVCDSLSVAANTIDQSAKRLVQRLGSAFRYVAGHDEMQAASARQLVDGTLTIQTENTVHLAEQHIKIDAEQVHLG